MQRLSKRYIVAYDLHLKTEENYRHVADAIESCGNAFEVQESVWIVHGHSSRDNIGESVWSVMSEDDKLIVTPITGVFQRGHQEGLRKFLTKHHNSKK